MFFRHVFLLTVSGISSVSVLRCHKAATGSTTSHLALFPVQCEYTEDSDTVSTDHTEAKTLESASGDASSLARPAHRLALLLELLQVLCEVDADAHHHVLGDQLPLPGVVVHLVEDVRKGLVAGQPSGGRTGMGGGEGEGARGVRRRRWVQR